MTVNKKIQIADYNSIRTSLSDIMGSGSGTQGYGQKIYSTAVSEGKTVTPNEWANLATDIVNIYRHQNGSSPTLTQNVVNSLIRSDSDTTSFTGVISGSTLRVESISSGMLAVGQTITGTGIASNTVITAIGTNPNIGLVSVTGKSGTSPCLVTFSISSQSVSITTGMYYIVTNSTNSSYNGRFLATAGNSTSITLSYPSDPGTLTGSPQVTMESTDPWGAGTWTLNNSQTVTKRTMTAASATEYPYMQYTKFFDGSRGDDLYVNRFKVSSSQAILDTTSFPAKSNAVSFSGTVSCTATITFGSADQARYFFNSGGELRCSSSFSLTLDNSQNRSWRDTLATTASNPKVFGGLKPATDFTSMDGRNFYRLTSTPQRWEFLQQSFPYTSNLWEIYASTPGVANNSTGTASTIQFLFRWVDGYVDPGTPAPGDLVQGTMSVKIDTYRASGTLLPSGFGDFTVANPISITYTNIA